MDAAGWGPQPADTAGISPHLGLRRENRQRPSAGAEAAWSGWGVYPAFFLPDYSCSNSTMILQIYGNDSKRKLWLGGSFAACGKALQVFREKLRLKKKKLKIKLNFVSHILLLLCISLCSNFLLRRSICCLVLGILLSFPNPWTFRSYFMACCWSSAMFKSSLNAIPRIQCLPCQHNSALCKQYLYSAFFFSLQSISR